MGRLGLVHKWTGLGFVGPTHKVSTLARNRLLILILGMSNIPNRDRSPDTRSSLDPMISQYSHFMIQKPVLVMSRLTVFPTFQFISFSPNYACDPLGSCNRWQTGVKYDLPDPS